VYPWLEHGELPYCAGAILGFQRNGRVKLMVLRGRRYTRQKAMLSLPPSGGTKVGAILYGLVAGISVASVIVFSSFLLGILAALISIHTPRINLWRISPLATNYFC
jgi:ABC-type multidrug transport system permease subunit